MGEGTLYNLIAWQFLFEYLYFLTNRTVKVKK